MQRFAWIDNLRALMIILVVMVHSAVTYSGIGSWYYIENEDTELASKFFFAFFQMFSQAYFMSLLFMIAGYFTHRSLERKPGRQFISGRLYRLGIPLVIYIFLLHPVSVRLAYPDLDMVQYFINGIKHFHFISWTGPMWFVEALLIFSMGYVLFRIIAGKRTFFKSYHLSIKNVISLILLITLLALLTRTVFPIGSSVTNLQLGFFPAYVVMYAFGIIAHRFSLFEKLGYREGLRWLWISLSIGIPLWLVIIFFGGPIKGDMSLEGGLNWSAFLYALWESFFCVTFILALVGIFRERYNSQGRLQKFLSDNAFGVYVFHAPVLIGISIILKDLPFYPVPKFILVSAIAVPATFLISWLIRKVKPLRKIFT